MIARGAIAAIFLTTLVEPSGGLIAIAAVGPLGSYLTELFGMGRFRLTEAILLAFIGAWLVQPPARDQGPRLPRYATTFGWLYGILVISLTAGVFSQLLRYPDILQTNLLALFESYFSYADPPGITEAAKVLEGLAVATAAMELFRQRPALARSLPAALAFSATAAAVTSCRIGLMQAPCKLLARELSRTLAV